MPIVNPAVRVGGVRIIVVSPKKNGTVVVTRSLVPRQVRG